MDYERTVTLPHLLNTHCKLRLATLPLDVHGTTFLPTKVPPWQAHFPLFIANILVVCFACVSDVVFRHIGLSAGVGGSLASWFAISWGGRWVHARKFCEGSAKATPYWVFKHSGIKVIYLSWRPPRKKKPVWWYLQIAGSKTTHCDVTVYHIIWVHRMHWTSE